MDLDDLFIKHGAASFDKQIYFDAMLGKAGWSFDLANGVLAFRRPHDEPLQLNAQTLGTESDESNTWLWAWANKTSGIPVALLMASLEIKTLGEKERIPELMTPEWLLSPKVNGQRFAAIASGVCRAGCYFRAPYPKGALYLLIKDPRFKRPVSRPIQRIARAFPMFLSDNSVSNQREAFVSYAKFYKLDVTDEPRRVIVSTTKHTRSEIGLEVSNRLIAEFDANNRLVSMQQTV
jgi:hypothetical protein